MKRILLILTALFTIAGLLDWLIYNKSKEVEELEDIYQIVQDNDGNRFEKPYKISGKFLRFEKNCNTMNFSNYSLINISELTTEYSDNNIYPTEVMIRKNDISRTYFLFEDLMEDYYFLSFIHNNRILYVSDNINLLTSKTFSYLELKSYFNDLENELIMDNLDSTLPLSINFKTALNRCSGYDYTFYYKGNDLFVDYYNYAPSYKTGINIGLNSSYKVSKEILKVVKNREEQLMQMNETENNDYSGLTVSFFHNNSIKTYNATSNFNPLYRDIERYKL